MDEFRLKKLAEMRAAGVIPYAAKFERSHKLAAGQQLSDGEPASLAGKVMLFREMGKMIFATLQDHTGRMQIAFKSDELDDQAFKQARDWIDLGDIIGVTGEKFVTKKGEPTLLIKQWHMLSKALRQPPEKWHGVQDQETAWRQRYLDLISNPQTKERFELRSLFVQKMREFYWRHNFTEVETPVLCNTASGALATPFVAHHAAYDMDVYLRIAAGETFQKECLVGGFDRTFEVARVFRNEGLDPSHLQDFTMCEHYAAYWDYEQNMQFTEAMLSEIIGELLGTTKIKIPDREGNLVEVDFAPSWPRISIKEMIANDCGVDIEQAATADELRAMMKAKGIKLEVPTENLGRGNLIDQLYKKVSRPKVVQPTFLIQHPVDLSPLARLNDENAAITDRFQLVVGGWEVVNAYSELVDPVDQAERFAAQAAAQAKGDSEAHSKDDEYVKALSYGCPPCSGWGMGIDRIVALLTQQENLRDVVLFPLMKPDAACQSEGARKGTSVSACQPEGVRSGAEGVSKANAEPLPDENAKRFVAVLNKKVDLGKLMNALGHMTAGLSDLASQSDDLCFLEYRDGEGGVHPSISHYPFIVLKADNGNKIRTVRQQALAKGIPFTDFVETMTIGSSRAQKEATAATKEEDLEYYGICLFGSSDELKELTGKFSLFK